MVETEGVIKYQLDFRPAVIQRPIAAEFKVWRSILYELGLVGQHPARYQGYGYGNLSLRSTADPGQFFITASQTGHLRQLNNQHYTLVEEADIHHNRIIASGALPPSSEALTHAMIYRLSADMNCVIHIHDPLLWHYGLKHNWPKTNERIEYGTPQMASEVQRLYRAGAFASRQCLFMAGHEDGIICFGNQPGSAAMALIQLWVAAYTHS